MTLLEQAQALVESIKGVTSSMIVSNVMSSLNDILLLQKVECQNAHKAVNTAKDEEDKVKLTYKMIENLLDKAKRMRQELRDEKYSNGL